MKSIKFYFGFIIIFSTFQFAQSQPGLRDYDKNSADYWLVKMRDPNINYFEISAEAEQHWANRMPVKGDGYKLFKRWQSFVKYYVDETGHIHSPAESLWAALDYMQKNPTDAIVGSWESLGPNEIVNSPVASMGRVTTIAFHPTDPNTLYAGTPLGGAWKSANGGASWTVMNTDQYTSLGVSAIAIDPNSPSVIYIGMGDRDGGFSRGNGIFKSSDGGNTWVNKSIIEGDWLIVHKIIIKPGSPNNIAVATNVGVYYSSNSGNSFTLGSGLNAWVMDMVVKPNDPNVLYACADGDFYKSTDFGQTWTLKYPTAGHRGAIAVTPANPEKVYYLLTKDSKFRRFYMSENAGENWQIVTSSAMEIEGQGGYNLDLAVDPNNENIIYAGFVNIYKSTDGGETWTRKTWLGNDTHADQHALEYSPHDGRLYIGNDGGVFVTDDGCETFDNISYGLQAAELYFLDVNDDDPEIITSGHQDGGCYVDDGGVWSHMTGGDGFWTKTDPNNVNIVYTSSQNGNVYRSTGGYYGGFHRIAAKDVNGIDQDGSWYSPFILDKNSSNIMFVGEKDLWRSTNVNTPDHDDIDWVNISEGQLAGGDNNIDFMEQSPVDGNRLYLIQGLNYYYRCDNALSANPTFMQRSKPEPWPIHWFEAHPTDLNTVYTICGWDLYKSTNGGNSWVKISGNLPVIPKFCILYQEGSNEGLYVSTSAGVYYKDADMSGWVLFKDGLPLTHVKHMEINYTTNPPVLFAATFGRGLWKTEVVPVFKPNIVGTTGSATVDGTNVTVLQGLSNQSDFNTTGDFHVGFYVSENNIIGTGDTKIGEVQISDMAPGMILQASLASTNVEIVEPLLDPGTYYFGAYADNQFEVDELNENDNRYLATMQVTIPGPPSAPINVAASDGTYSNRIFISWENPGDAQFYAVYRSEVNNPATAVKITPTTWISTLSYYDYNVPQGADYYYWVKSSRYNTGIRSSDFSAVNAGWRQLGAPTNVQATDGQFSVRVTITWTAPTNATHYRVFRSVIDNPSLATNISGTNWFTGTYYHDMTAVAGTTYYYWVKAALASDGYRSSAYSTSNPGWIAFADAPVVTASDGTHTDKVAITYTTVSGAPYFKLFRGTTSNPDASTALTGWQTTASYNDMSAATGTIYYYFVKAANDQFGTNTTGYSAAETGYRNFIPPTNLQATDGTVIERTDITWSASSGALRYKVYRHTQGNFANASPVSNWITATSFSDFTSVPGLTHYYWVVAASDTILTLSQPAGSESGWCLLNSPTVTATKGIYSNHVHVAWEPVNGGVAYRVYRSLISSSTPAPMISWSTTLNFEYDDYTAVQGEQYWYYVKAARNTGGLRESDYGQDIGFADVCGNMIEDPAFRSVMIEGSTIYITTRIINEGPYALANPGQIAFALEDAAPFGITDFMLGYADIPPLSVGAHNDVNFSVDLNSASPGPVSYGSWYVGCFTSWDFANCDANMNDDYIVWETMPFDYTDAMYGEYKVGSIAGDFGDLDKAITALHTRGISDQVIFNLEPAVFVEQFELGQVDGCTPEHNLIFRTDPAAKGDTAEIVFAPSELKNYTIQLNNCSNITFENLKLSTYGFTNYATTYGRVIDITGNCSNIRIAGNYINGYTDDSYTDDDNAVIMCHEGIMSDITIEENLILNGSTAIKMIGMSLNPDYIISPAIRNNEIQNFIYSGIDLVLCDEVEISGNYLFTPDGSDRVALGINLDRLRNGIIMTENNIIMNTNNWTCKGIYCVEVNLDGGQRGLIANNMVAIKGNATNMYGVFLYDLYRSDIYHNSVHIAGTHDVISVDMLLDCPDGSVWGYNNNLKNNILMNSAGGFSLVYNDNAFNHQFIETSDYNDFLTTGQYIFQYKSTNYFETLTEWINATGFDNHSFTVYPHFNSDTDLHVNSQDLDGMGYPVEGVIRDIDGDPRDNIHPDIGADEYTYIEPIILLETYAILEGPFNNTDMNANLTGVSGFPLAQPYSVSPWNYSGTESVTAIPANVVDWILIELRDAPTAALATSGTRIARQAALLKKDGSIVAMDGTSLLQFSNSINYHLFVVIWHRNHLAIMSANPLVKTGDTYTCDFRTSVEKAFGGAVGFKEWGAGIAVMIAADGNADGTINNFDKLGIWNNHAGKKGYLQADFNLDGQVNNPDKNGYFLPNLDEAYTSQVPD